MCLCPLTLIGSISLCHTEGVWLLTIATRNLIVPAMREVLQGQQEVPWLRQPGFKEFQEVTVLCGIARRMRRVCYYARAGDRQRATQRDGPLKITCLHLMHVCH